MSFSLLFISVLLFLVVFIQILFFVSFFIVFLFFSLVFVVDSFLISFFIVFVWRRPDVFLSSSGPSLSYLASRLLIRWWRVCEPFAEPFLIRFRMYAHYLFKLKYPFIFCFCLLYFGYVSCLLVLLLFLFVFCYCPFIKKPIKNNKNLQRTTKVYKPT